MSQTIIKKCSKDIKLETILKATAITKFIDKLEKSKMLLKIKCTPNKIKSIVIHDLENDSNHKKNLMIFEKLDVSWF